MTKELTAELKAELGALVPTEDATIEVEFQDAITDISQVTVDDSAIDVSEADNEEDADFLRKAGHEILLIDAKADFAIAQITKRIKGRASLEKGRVIDAIQQKRGSLDGKKSGLYRYWHSLGFWDSNKMEPMGLSRPSNPTAMKQLSVWSRAYRAVSEAQELFGGLVDTDTILAAGDATLATVSNLPTDTRQELLAEIVSGESVPSESQVKAIAAKPEVKLSKAQELLAKAKERQVAAKQELAAVKANPNISATVGGIGNTEYAAASKFAKNADKSVANYEKQIEELTKQIEEQAKKAEADAKATKALSKEIEALKKDDTAVRKRRINQLSQSLVSQLPDIQSDLLKFFAEKEFYEKTYCHSIESTAIQLYEFLAKQLDGEKA